MIDFEIWPVRERVLEAFGNDSIHRILRVKCRNCVPSLELRRRLYPTSIPALLVQRRLHRFGHAARRPDGELIKLSYFYRHYLACSVGELPWRPVEDVGIYDQGRPGTPLRTAGLRPHTIEKGLGGSS